MTSPSRFRDLPLRGSERSHVNLALSWSSRSLREGPRGFTTIRPWSWRRMAALPEITPGDLGFKPVHTSVGELGVLVCWDQWYPEAARLMALNGAELLIYPTAIGGVGTDSREEQQTQRQAWQLVQRGHSVANGLPVITVNRVGHEDDPSGNTIGLDFWGYSFATGPQGEILAQFSTDTEENRVVEIDLDRTEYVRRGWPFLRDRRIDAYGPILDRFGK